jgi:hypothetical protein
MTNLVLAARGSSLFNELVAALQSPDAATTVVDREDLTFLARQLNPKVVLLEVDEVPDVEDPIYALSRLSASTGLAVIGVRASPDDDLQPAEAPRTVFISHTDGAEHLSRVVAAFLEPQPAPAAQIAVGADSSWPLDNEG